MQGNKAGAGVVLIIAIVVAISFTYVLTTPTGTSKITIPTNPAHTNTTNLWADAAGWNFNHGTVNPALNYSVGTVVTFHVTEEDTAPHTLYVVSAPSSPTQPPASYENQNNGYQILSTTQITQTKGHTVNGQYYFGTAGVYVYWCTIHPTTMIGWLYVNASASSSVSSSVHSTSQTPSTSGNSQIAAAPNYALSAPGASLSYMDNTASPVSSIASSGSHFSEPSNINPELQYPSYLDMSTVSGTAGGSVEL